MTQRALRLGLAVLCAGLVAVVTAELTIGASGAAVSVVPESKAGGAVVMPIVPNIDAMVAEILERPLFTSTRLPYEQIADQEEEQEEQEQVRSRLTGIMIRPEGREALFELSGTKPTAVKEGGQIDGWTVKTIRIDQVILSNDDGEEVVKPTQAPVGVRAQQRVANGANAAQPRRSATAPQAPSGAPTIRAPQPAAGSRQAQK